MVNLSEGNSLYLHGLNDDYEWLSECYKTEDVDYGCRYRQLFNKYFIYSININFTFIVAIFVAIKDKKARLLLL